ncbi:16S rRNA (adenine(1518)-N(6)/adenine(1519)-N(6))-dimethyltransferase RsmA [Helicobacter didelphidarum]|uniref:Ribosomal RNA small subunit methyltransferase A n=1 Tax=Helicobacter didelphidarum TaxID=2040648 RepID=A0A3D8IRU3_9HELI|nr:16S rRNA (adenine(1518)-N(6)/adenine(1519)-N(6))-dimethyltransferase RsmA [Helicobacter didelphidarum]RDU67656.1 16S rRNA (adenine(1518)-N(6)/adenine(1519)-N(6))-dimethyltransferase RsmA [Helicobacter didelphidarum]
MQQQRLIKDCKRRHKQEVKYSSCKNIKEKETQMKAKKSLGQNFLQDEVILDKIIKSIPYNVAQSIELKKVQLIEIGVGLGDLTRKLLDKYNVLTYEVDSNLIARAKRVLNEFLVNKRLTLEEADVLKICKGNGYLFESEYFLVSNLPYYIATPIILRAMRDKQCCGFLVMTQREVAQKFCAKVSSKDFCALSVLSESYGTISYLFEVSPQCFIPQPKVYSAVFCFERFSKEIPDNLELLLKHAFKSPRKKLFSNLMDMLSKQDMQKIFYALNLRNDIRPHEVSTQTYLSIAQLLGNNLKE